MGAGSLFLILKAIIIPFKWGYISAVFQTAKVSLVMEIFVSIY